MDFHKGQNSLLKFFFFSISMRFDLGNNISDLLANIPEFMYLNNH